MATNSILETSFTFKSKTEINPIVYGIKSIAGLCDAVSRLSCNKAPFVGSELVKLGIISKEMTPETNKMWRLFKIDKKNGKQRQIITPSSTRLMNIHKGLSFVFDEMPVSDSSYAYVKGRGPINAAWCVAKSKPDFLWREDIKDFFPSISDSMIRKYLIEKMGWGRRVAALVSYVSTFCGQLVQGSVLSPTISNIIMKDCHDNIRGAAEKHNLNYIAYGDDLYVFGKASKEEEDVIWDKLKWEISGELKKAGMRLNYEKCVRKRGALKVLSMTIKNGYVIYDQEVNRNVRAMLLNIAMKKMPHSDGKPVGDKVVSGKISWIYSNNNTMFNASYGKYVKKLERWYPGVGNVIAPLFPVEFRNEYFPDYVAPDYTKASLFEIASMFW